MIGGTVMLTTVEKLGVVDAFYCVCTTITTLGYGDMSFGTKAGRTFAIFWILTGTASLAQFFFYVAELRTEHRQKELVKWVLARKLTPEDLEAADLDKTRDVVLAEFILFKLKEMGKISDEDVTPLMEEFERRDIDKNKKLTVSDISLAQQTGSYVIQEPFAGFSPRKLLSSVANSGQKRRRRRETEP
ncbi:hypothetical protein F0562_008713 [Nyssa sinensis]|uniref:Potassium channel domain-containing protein n=1 Tax=Nyssa sinensis TaxID=561372 RepID=A0A5J5AAK8_9ASTE|nr:hypothetical protein F0562_008713 [Nyssa sinensis]